ncbi:MAG TPA: transporter [Albitalea sp.]
MPQTTSPHRPARRVLRLLALAAGTVALAAAHAEEPLATDRPDTVESADVVGRGRVQIETGYARERDESAGVRATARTVPTLVRLGVSERLEVRVESDTRTRVRVEDPSGATAHLSGTADASIGIKWRQQDDDPATRRPAIAWLAHLDLDTGSAPFRGHGVRPSLRMVAAWDLPNDWSLGVMPGLFADRDEADRRFVGGILAVTAGKGWTDRFGTFVEVAAEQIARSRHGGSVVMLDVGATYLLTDSMQVDTAFSHGLNRNAPDRRWTVGFSVRF